MTKGRTNKAILGVGLVDTDDLFTKHFPIISSSCGNNLVSNGSDLGGERDRGEEEGILVRVTGG